MFYSLFQIVIKCKKYKFNTMAEVFSQNIILILI